MNNFKAHQFDSFQVQGSKCDRTFKQFLTQKQRQRFYKTATAEILYEEKEIKQRISPLTPNLGHRINNFKVTGSRDKAILFCQK